MNYLICNGLSKSEGNELLRLTQITLSASCLYTWEYSSNWLERLTVNQDVFGSNPDTPASGTKLSTESLQELRACTGSVFRSVALVRGWNGQPSP